MRSVTLRLLLALVVVPAVATAAPASAELDLGGCGAPAALEAFKIATEVFKEVDAAKG